MSNDFNPYAASYAPPSLPDQFTSGNVLADRSTRFVGALIDGLIIMPLILPVALAIGFAVATVFGSESVLSTIVSTFLGGLVGIGCFLLVHGYLLAKNGQTVGKKLMKMKIVRDDGSQMPFGELIIKRYGVFWILGMIPYVGGLFNIANALAIFRESRKCLHDDIAGTKVIKL